MFHHRCAGAGVPDGSGPGVGPGGAAVEAVAAAGGDRAAAGAEGAADGGQGERAEGTPHMAPGPRAVPDHARQVRHQQCTDLI